MADRPFNDFGFQQFLQEEVLMGSQCTVCDALFVPPRTVCTHCYNWELKWSPLKGTGRLVAFSCIALGPPWMVDQGFDREHPYCAGVVQLDEGPRIVARIDEMDAERPENIKIGTAVRTKYLQRAVAGSLQTSLIFVPA